MFYKRYIYKGKTHNRPMVHFDRDLRKSYTLDIDVQRILEILPKPSAENNELCFWLDNTAQSFAYITIYTMIGDGFTITVEKDKEAEKKIRQFNRRININGDTIDDFLVDAWIDSLIHGQFIWRIAKDIRGIDNERMEGPDIQRLPPETIRTERDQINGWRKFIQTIPVHQTYRSPEEFIRADLPNLTSAKSEIVIQDDQTIVLTGNLFKKPPMNSALPFIVLKFWILTFIRKFAEKMWAPYMLGFVGDPRSNTYPGIEEEMQEALELMSTALMKLKNFSTGAFPGDSRVEMKELTNKGTTYLEFLDMANREIMFALFSSIAARESVGVYKANQIADESTVRFMTGIRKKFENILKRFYVMNLTPGITEDDILFSWPELRTSSVDNIANAIEKLVTYGVFKDAKERRRAAAQIFPWLMEESLTDEQMSKLDKQFEDLNKPSQPFGQAVKNGQKASSPKVSSQT